MIEQLITTVVIATSPLWIGSVLCYVIDTIIDLIPTKR